MKKRLTALILCLMIASMSLVGCSGGDNPSSNNSGQAVSTESSGDAASEENSDTPPGEEGIDSGSTESTGGTSNGNTGSTGTGSTGKTPSKGSGGTTNPAFQKMDLKGRKIRILAGDSWKNTSKSEDIAKKLQYFKDAEKEFNCKFEFRYMTDYIKAIDELVKGYMSGKPTFDVLEMRGYNVAPLYASSKTILNLSDYYDYDKDPAWKNEYVKNVGVWRGDRYGLTYGDTAPGYALWYNKKLFAAANVPDPWTYVKNNTWNWATFRDVCKKLTRDTNGDKKIDVWAFNAEDPVGMFMITNGAQLIDTSGNSASFAGGSKAGIEAIEYYKLLNGIDKVVPDSATSGLSPTVFDQFPTNRLAMFPYSAGYGPHLIKKGMKVEDIGWVYWPKGNAVKDKDYIIPSLTEPSCWVVANKISNSKEVVHAMTYATAFWSDSKTSNKGDILQGVEFAKKSDDYMDFFEDDGFAKIMAEGPSKTAYTKMFNYENAAAAINEMVYKITSGQLSTSTALKTYTSKIDSLIKGCETGKIK